jgi:acyl-CoA hydrolase
MACNTDICLEEAAVIKQKRENGERAVMLAEANVKMPFMYGDAVIDADTYDIILEGEDFNYTLFGPPKDAVALPDHMIGINVSTLVRDGGTIQVGIGALGDAIVAGLVMRNTHNEVYREILEKSGIMAKHGDIIKKWGDTKVFRQGLYGSSEMFVDAFMQMYKNKILKRKVFDSVPLMKLINKGELSADKIPADIIDKLIEMKAIHAKLTEEDFRFLTEFGILKKDLKYTKTAIKDGKTGYSTDLSDKANRTKIRKILGSKLLNGHIILGAFFVGPKAFYDALNGMSEDERKLFAMSGVEKVNQLYGGRSSGPSEKRCQFINTGMVATILGSIASDQLQDGRLVSGSAGSTTSFQWPMPSLTRD